MTIVTFYVNTTLDTKMELLCSFLHFGVAGFLLLLIVMGQANPSMLNLTSQLKQVVYESYEYIYTCQNILVSNLLNQSFAIVSRTSTAEKDEIF